MKMCCEVMRHGSCSTRTCHAHLRLIKLAVACDFEHKTGHSACSCPGAQINIPSRHVPWHSHMVFCIGHNMQQYNITSMTCEIWCNACLLHAWVRVPCYINFVKILPHVLLWSYLVSAGSQTGLEHDMCQAGSARTSLHMGDTKQGRALALDSNSPQLCRECAQILESQDKQQVPGVLACQHKS